MGRQQHSARARGADDVAIPPEDRVGRQVRADVAKLALDLMRFADLIDCPAETARRYRRMAGALRAVAARWRLSPDEAMTAGITGAEARQPRDARGGER